jgi:hypothetical protein
MISEDELLKKYLAARTELMKIPGVMWVGYGTKERAGELTKESALRVYVLEKRAPNELSPDEVIPDRVNGLATDVLKIETSTPQASCQDLEIHNKAIGGISISNLKDFKRTIATQSQSPLSDEVGTLGCVAIIDGLTSKDRFALLTNHHVLGAQGGTVNDAVYQVQLKAGAGGSLTLARKLTGSVGAKPTQILKLEDFAVFELGKIMDRGMEGNFSYAYPGEAEDQYYIDCMAAKVSTDFSSWCNSNKGVDFANEIRGLNVAGGNLILKTGRLKIGSNGKKVIKVGRASSRTVGEVVDPLASIFDFNTSPPTLTHKNVIFIKAVDPNCDGVLRFSEKGDSGSAIITEDGELVGLLFGDNNETDLTKLHAHACHIHPACTRLLVTPLTKEQNSLLTPAPNPASPPGPQPSTQPAPAPALPGSFQPGFQPGTAITRNTVPRAVQERLSGSARGSEFLELLEKHRPELVHLINKVRPVLVTWHRSKGAAYLTHFINSFRDPDYVVPPEIEGISLRTAVATMAEALRAHGSRELVQSVNQHVDEALSLADHVRRTEDLFAHLTNA